MCMRWSRRSRHSSAHWQLLLTLCKSEDQLCGTCWGSASRSTCGQPSSTWQCMDGRRGAQSAATACGPQGTMEACRQPVDMALALHACGSATDYALLQAQRLRAAFIVSPCCVGKLKFATPGGQQPCRCDAACWRCQPTHASAKPHALEHAQLGGCSVEARLHYPRSRWLMAAVRHQRDYNRLARAADFSHIEGHSHPDAAQAAKVHSPCCVAISWRPHYKVRCGARRGVVACMRAC